MIAGQAASFMGALVGLKVLTHLADVHTYGEFALGLTIVGLLHMLLYGPLSQTALRFWSVPAAQEDRGRFLADFLRLHRVLALVLTPLTAATVVVIWFAVGAGWAQLILFAVLAAMVSGFQMSLASVQSAARRRRRVATFQALESWLKPLGATVCFFAFEGSAIDFLAGYVVASLLVVIAQVATFGQGELHGTAADRRAMSGEGTLQRDMLSYAAPFLAFAVLGSLSQFLDRWILVASQSMEAVGQYAAILQVATAPIALGFGVVNQFLVPITFDHASDTKRAGTIAATVGSAAALCLGATVGAAAVAAALGKELLLLATTHEIAAHWKLLWILILAVGLFQTAQLLSIVGLANLRPKAYIWTKAVQAVALAGSGVPLAIAFGSRGMAWALVISSFCYLLSVLLTNRILSASSPGSRRNTLPGY